MERITNATLAARCENVNRRLHQDPPRDGAAWIRSGVTIQGRNGYTALDWYENGSLVRTLAVGTKREIADFLHAMMVGIDLSRGQ